MLFFGYKLQIIVLLIRGISTYKYKYHAVYYKDKYLDLELRSLDFSACFDDLLLDDDLSLDLLFLRKCLLLL